MKNYESLIDAVADLKIRGYKEDFELGRTCLYCDGLDLRLNPGEFVIDEAYSFGGDSSLDDRAVIYAISSGAGVKGTLVDPYGVYAEKIGFEMAQKLRTY